MNPHVKTLLVTVHNHHWSCPSTTVRIRCLPMNYIHVRFMCKFLFNNILKRWAFVVLQSCIWEWGWSRGYEGWWWTSPGEPPRFDSSVAIQLGRMMTAKNVRHLVNHFICDHNYDDGRGMGTWLACLLTCLLGQPRRKARPQGNSSIIVSWWRANLDSFLCSLAPSKWGAV